MWGATDHSWWGSGSSCVLQGPSSVCSPRTVLAYFVGWPVQAPLCCVEGNSSIMDPRVLWGNAIWAGVFGLLVGQDCSGVTCYSVHISCGAYVAFLCLEVEDVV